MKKKSTGYEVEFMSMLEPYLVMLAAKRSVQPFEVWRGLVNRTKVSVIKNPDQYLGSDLPRREIIHVTVSNVFNEFLSRPENE